MANNAAKKKKAGRKRVAKRTISLREKANHSEFMIKLVGKQKIRKMRELKKIIARLKTQSKNLKKYKDNTSNQNQ